MSTGEAERLEQGQFATSTPHGTGQRQRERRDGPGDRVTLTVDGTEIEGNVVPRPPLGTERVVVEVVLS